VRRGAALVALVAPVLFGGGDDGGGGDPAKALADRLVAVLEAAPGTVDGDVADARVTCPVVHDPAAGDEATCVLRFPGDRRVEVDVEFQADGSIDVVSVVG
jgi:hypothetical protein